MLIAIVLLLMMHITWATALSMVHYHQRVVEARNSAYKTELYLGGEPSQLDKIIQKADEDVIQPLEATLAKFDPVLEYVDLDEQISSAMNSMLKYLGSPVNSYSKHETDNDQLYTDMIELTWDNMNEYKVDKGDNELMIDRVKPLISIIRDKNSSFSTGIGFSQYYPFAGIFTTGTKPLLMRSYHYADFADFVDILGNDDLQSGYNEEMEKLLPPVQDRKLFNTIFPSENEAPVFTPVVLPPFPIPGDDNLGITPKVSVDQAWEDYKAENGYISFEDWMNDVAYPDLYSHDELRKWAAARNFDHPDNPDWKLYPPDNGFTVTGVYTLTLQPGVRLDRYGGTVDGEYFGDPNQGEGKDGRGLPDNSSNEYTEYVVKKPFPVRAGQAAPWFNDAGGKNQYFIGPLGEGWDVAKLIDQKYIEVVEK